MIIMFNVNLAGFRFAVCVRACVRACVRESQMTVIMSRQTRCPVGRQMVMQVLRDSIDAVRRLQVVL